MAYVFYNFEQTYEQKHFILWTTAPHNKKLIVA